VPLLGIMHAKPKKFLSSNRKVLLIILNLIEFEAKQVLLRYGIPIPKGILISDSKQIVATLSNLKPPYMVKAQVPVSGRGKAGGIIPANSIAEAQSAVIRLLGAQIKSFLVRQVLIEEKLATKKEVYLGFKVDRFNRCYVMLASKVGGVEVEEVAEKTPQTIVRTPVDAQLGLRSFDALSIAKKLGYGGDQLVELSSIIQKLYRAAIENDAELAEINPLIETDTAGFVAADARMVIDDNALFRHPEYDTKEAQTLSSMETLALKNNLAYVKLDGDIGVVGNGAGLVMATVDLLNYYGGKPADFLDIGGGASVEAIRIALRIVLEDPDTKSVLVNVLGGITRCDEVARGIIEAVEDGKVKKPLAVRLVGTNEKEGLRILADAGISALDSMEEAAKEAVKFAVGAK
jgi:succinyl-CoA synthetase beta subunit